MPGETASDALSALKPDQPELVGSGSIRAPREFIALDLETTGLSPKSDRIVEIGAIRFLANGDELARYETLVNPQQAMPESAYAIHGLSDEMLSRAPAIRDVIGEFFDFLGEPGSAMLLAHHASFDAGFLGSELGRAGMECPGHFVVDTLAIARRRLPDLRSHRLDYLAAYFGLDAAGAHRAIGDSRRVKELWLRLEGAADPDDIHVSFPIRDVRESNSMPRGSELLTTAAALGRTVRIVYTGGTRGSAPRLVSPRNFTQRGGYNYMVAFCHLDGAEKSFRLDRILKFEVVTETGPVDCAPPRR